MIANARAKLQLAVADFQYGEPKLLGKKTRLMHGKLGILQGFLESLIADIKSNLEELQDTEW